MERWCTSLRTCKSNASKNALRNHVIACSSREESKLSTKEVALQAKIFPRSKEGRRVLVTGATKGLGSALAKEFVRAGDCVCICSRKEEDVSKALREISRVQDGIRACGTTCDVGDPQSVKELFEYAKWKMDGIDVLINNAGTNAYAYEDLVDADTDHIRDIVWTNAMGTLLCCREGLRVMSSQSQGGFIFNLEGAGSDGRPTRKFAAYGYTKAGMAQLSKTIQMEVNEAGKSQIGVHTISPGMVFTEMIASGRYSFGERGRFFVNLLAEDADVVAASLVQQVHQVIARPNAKTETQSIKYLKPIDVVQRLLARLILGVNKDRWYPESDDA